MPYNRAIPQQPNLARLAELLQNAKSSGNQYSVPNWVPLLGGSGAGDMLLGNAPEEIENWSYGDMPMRVPEMSNVPQFKQGRAQSLADTAMLLAGPAESTARNAMAGNVGMIIKPKGGNWLDAFGRSPEKSATQFGRSVDPELAGYARAGMHLMPHEYNETVPVMAVNDWLKQKLAKYIQNEMATPEDPIRRIAEEWPAKRDVLISQQQSKIPNLQELAAKYEDMGLPPEVIANRMANANRDALTIQDKISELEGYNPLHYTPRDPREFDIDDVMAKREAADYPAEGIAKTNLGKLWEHYADENITPIRVKSISDMNEENNPWLKKLDKEDQVYFPDTMVGTGFDKLADELRKATRPDTDLPDFLRIDPAKLSRVSVPQAVEHVAKINAWRDAERLKEGRNTATVMHKEYPDQGLAWMQMKMPENQDKEALRAALKFEGDTMGHCVGQYCDEVAGGDSNIYSLRDRRGEPHVTIETKGGGFDPNKFLDLNKQIINDDSYLRDKLKYLQENYANRPERQSDLMLDAMKKYGYEYQLPETMEKIVQIKGKQNAAPNAKYLPAVHDFIRSKDWSSVGDLDNTHLYDLSQPFLHPELQEMVKNKYGKFATEDEINALEKEFHTGNNFADGGLVGTPPTAYDPMKVADIVASIDAPYNY
ncbi:PcfJ domain-containing protein [Chromatium okenii]|uniref:PcfJ domain-containing protein n=1 Tax=Chromatium okenii TaxID=61644 RepID=UPI0026EC7953|nr:PcfJ domain-containing protein [Chromatium okenii]MBV5309076.1 PcfJ domain-containing protein [Chromatium okenii]